MAGNYVIAGGTSGIGLKMVQRLAPHADQIVVLSRSQDDLELADNIRHVAVDFLQDDLPEMDLPEAIHGAAYCPGTINLKSFRALKVDDFRADFETNLVGAVKFLQACAKGLKQGSGEQTSSVVLFSTVAVQKGLPMHASVAAAKGAIEGLARSLAAEWAPAIRVNCIAPALTETPLAARLFRSDEARQNMAAKYPLKRTGLPADISSMAEFLLYPSSSWITGQVFGVDGGMSSLGGN